MRRIIFSLLILILPLYLFSQPLRDSGYVLSVEKDGVYLDLTKNDVKPGDKFIITRPGGYFIHPVTKQKIKKEDIVVAYLEITKVFDQYSFAKVFPDSAISQVKPGMVAKRVHKGEKQDVVYRKTLLVQPFKVIGLGKNYLGELMKDVLVEQLYKLNKFKILDNDIGSARPDYIITASAYPPEVVQVSNNVPIKNIVNLAEIASGKNFGSDYLSNARLTKLKATVTVTIRIIDPKTGEIVYTFSRTGQAVGKSSVELEGGIMSGVNIPGELFYQSVSGKATQAALKLAANDIYQFLVYGKKVQQQKSKKVKKSKLSIIDVIPRNDSVYFTLNYGNKSKYRLRKDDEFEIYAAKKSEKKEYQYIGRMKLNKVKDSVAYGLFEQNELPQGNYDIFNSKLYYVHPNFISITISQELLIDKYPYGHARLELGSSIFKSSKFFNRIALGAEYLFGEPLFNTRIEIPKGLSLLNMNYPEVIAHNLPVYLRFDFGYYLNRLTKGSFILGGSVVLNNNKTRLQYYGRYTDSDFYHESSTDEYRFYIEDQKIPLGFKLFFGRQFGRSFILTYDLGISLLSDKIYGYSDYFEFSQSTDSQGNVVWDLQDSGTKSLESSNIFLRLASGLNIGFLIPTSW